MQLQGKWQRIIFTSDYNPEVSTDKFLYLVENGFHAYYISQSNNVIYRKSYADDTWEQLY